jgi:hypothetical protein
VRFRRQVSDFAWSRYPERGEGVEAQGLPKAIIIDKKAEKIQSPRVHASGQEQGGENDERRLIRRIESEFHCLSQSPAIHKAIHQVSNTENLHQDHLERI